MVVAFGAKKSLQLNEELPQLNVKKGTARWAAEILLLGGRMNFLTTRLPFRVSHFPILTTILIQSP